MARPGLIVLGSIALAATMGSSLQSAPAGVAMVTGIYGAVQVQHGAQAPVTVHVHQMVAPGDIVSTDSNSRGVLLLNDGSSIKLQNDTKVQFPPSGRGLKVLDGEVFAHMEKQHGGPFHFDVPAGRADVIGTDLDLKVAHATRESTDSVLTVAKGQVNYAAASTGHAVRVAQGNQSILTLHVTPEVTYSSALKIATPSEPVEVDVDPIIAWNRQVQAYSEAIAKLHDEFEMLDADAKAHNGFLSPDMMTELTDAEDEIQSMVPDEDFKSGHQDLLLAFQNYKVALSMTANPSLQAQARDRAENAYHAADLALRFYKLKNQARLTQFLQR